MIEDVSATATETSVHFLDPFAPFGRFGATRGRHQVLAFDTETFDAALAVDANRDGQILPSGLPPTPFLSANADTVTAEQPYLSLANTDDDDGDGQPDYVDPTVNGANDLADFSPVFLDLKPLLAALPVGPETRVLLKQADGALNFVYTSLTRATAFTFRDEGGEPGFGPDFNQPAASAPVERITAEGVALSAVFLDRIRNQHQGVILLESRGPTVLPLVLVVETGTGTAVVTLPLNAVQAGLAVDANRDGVIRLGSEDASDATSAGQPFRFWVNDDVDRLNVFFDSAADTLAEVAETEHDDLGPAEVSAHNAAEPTDPWLPDWEDGKILDARDLEDFSRLHVDLGNFAERIARGDFFLGLRFKDVRSGHPKIQLYPAADSAGGLGYLTDDGAAILQTAASGQEFGHAVRDRANEPTISQDRLFVFQLDRWQGGRSRVPFLFEATEAGRGRLTLVLVASDGVSELGEIASVHLEVRRIGDMYEHWSVGNGGGGEPEPIAARIPSLTGSPAAFEYDSDGASPEERRYILFVHGWNMERWEKERYAETAYKRLWWQGYKGRFGLFSWPTTNRFGGVASAILDSTNFDRGEWTAWRSAPALRQVMQRLFSDYAGELHVFSHGMGGIAVGEALRLQGDAGGGLIAKVYVASQAALSAHAYDGTLSADVGASNALQWDYDHPQIPGGTQNFGPGTANIYPGWFAFVLNGGGGGTPTVGSLVNFYNQNDWALSAPIWQFNQISKPDVPDFPEQPFTYDYDSILDRFARANSANVRTFLDLGTRANPGDRYEIMAFAAESRVKAFGATPNVSQVISRAVDLQSVWGADPEGQNHKSHKWHSGQFRSTIQRQRNYWKTLLDRPGFDITTGATLP